MVFGPLSISSIKIFVDKYSEEIGVTFPGNHFESFILPALRKERTIHFIDDKCLCMAQMKNPSREGQDAFWAYLNTVVGSDWTSLIPMHYPFQASYIKNDNKYCICRCKGNGMFELGLVRDYEQKFLQYTGNSQGSILRFLILFSSEAQLKQAPQVDFQSPVLWGTVQYDFENTPTLTFRRDR